MRSCAGLVERAEDWPLGSLYRRVRGGGGFSLGDWPLPHPRNWARYVNAPQAEAELEAIQRWVRRGSPYGNASWMERIAEELGLQSTLR